MQAAEALEQRRNQTISSIERKHKQEIDRQIKAEEDKLLAFEQNIEKRQRYEERQSKARSELTSKITAHISKQQRKELSHRQQADQNREAKEAMIQQKRQRGELIRLKAERSNKAQMDKQDMQAAKYLSKIERVEQIKYEEAQLMELNKKRQKEILNEKAKIMAALNKMRP